MKIYHNQLSQTLNQGFKPVWLIFGDEPWQKNDALVQIKQAAQTLGFSEIIRFSADDKFDWSLISQEYNALSLFASQRIIEIELVKPKLSEPASKALLALADNFHQDVMLIIHGGKLDSGSQNKKWFKHYQQSGCYLPLYDVEGKALNQWIMQRAKQFHLTLAPDLIPFLTELFSGNLLALSQELEKLSILFDRQTITIEDAEPLLIKQAKFNPFQLIDPLLLGDLDKALQILGQLNQEGVAPGQLTWLLHKEFKQLEHMIELKNNQQPINEIYKQFRIWDKRKPLYQHALNHISLANVQTAILRLIEVDLLTKTTSEFDAYVLFYDVCTTLYHGNKTRQFQLSYEYQK